MINIPESEVRQRFQKLRNFEALHPRLKERHQKVQQENRVLKGKNKTLEKEKKQKEKEIEKLQLELEELKALKFGKRRKTNPKVHFLPLLSKKKEKKKRTSESYRRKPPKKEEVTDHLHLEREVCPECGEELSDTKKHVHYREDLKKAEELMEAARQIVETTIESGICRNPECSEYNKRSFALEIPKQNVILGENLRRMVVYMAILQGQSYSEIERGLLHQHGISLSSGEISNILEGESRVLTPYYNSLVTDLEKESAESGCHYDETTWKTKNQGQEVSEGNYAWVKIGTRSEKRILWLGKSRGKGVAEALRGEKRNAKGVSDDYGSYTNLFDYHQLCWAHPHRKLRDLSESGSLTGRTKQLCSKAFKDFSKLYQKARRARERLRKGKCTERQKEQEQEILKKCFRAITEPHEKDPEKLQKIKNSLRKKEELYFTFIDFPCLPLDNNKAERALRKLVLKRKKSFGSKSQKGADVLSVLSSTIFSMTEECPEENFFTLYERMANWSQ